MVCESTLIKAPVQVSVSMEGGMQVQSSLSIDAPIVSTGLMTGLKVATAILCSLMIVAAQPIPQMTCETEIILPIMRSQLRGNFITLDDCYVMTADGQIFYVQED